VKNLQHKKNLLDMQVNDMEKV